MIETHCSKEESVNSDSDEQYGKYEEQDVKYVCKESPS